MKSRLILAALMLSAMVAAHTLRAADEDKLKDVKCPVSGQKINPDATVEHNGG